MKRFALALAALLIASPGLAQARIGIAAPLTDSAALLGEQIEAGAKAAAGTAGVETVTADTACTSEGGKAAAERLLAEGASIVIGFLCTEAIEAALPILTGKGVPVIDVGVRANRLTDRRERSGQLVWRVAPRSDAEATAIAESVATRWSDEPFGFIEDGSIANRALTDTVRRLLGDKGLQPSLMDNFRPAEEKQFGLARRLQRSGVTRFVIAGDRPDIAVILRDAAELGLDLEVIGGESLMDETSVDQPLGDGVIAVLPPMRFPALVETLGDKARGYTGPAYASAEIAVEAFALAKESDRSLADILNGETFETVLGPARFDEKGDSGLLAWRPYVWTGEDFAPLADQAAHSGSDR
ncbi:MAG: ABC transporter substrate-binding protein [Fulvimarina manganoxydans]|uniref:ABC transporter substrate-binding protein n=1 Tax=Fulvimarina manganoxydans TaxID=937218 RepID=UPI0023556E58|nr:ABC transporter substrate-binding protein [Fulvimarina manganoxydans]MCK5932455.1 ABC transporter substrate-binding protein [Fulvimarina manganoxydans]